MKANLPLLMLMIPVFGHFYLEGCCRGKISALPKRLNKPWFTDTCKDAIEERDRAIERFECEPDEGNPNACHIARAKAKVPDTIINNNKTSRKNYVPKMNSQTSVKYVRNSILRIKGNDTSNTVPCLAVNDREDTSHRDIAMALANNFSHDSSSAFSTDAFASVRRKYFI